MAEEKEELVNERSHLLPKSEDIESGSRQAMTGAPFLGPVFNLSCTIVGSGIMSLPATLKILGVVPGIVLIVFAAFFSEASIEMLLRFSKPSSASSYGDLMADAFGTTGKISVQISVILNNIGCLIVYMIIIEDVFSGSTTSGVHNAGVLEEWFGEHWWTGRAFVLIVITAVVFVPLICFKYIDSLKFTSAISIALAVVFLVVVTGITIYKLIEGSIQKPTWFPSVTNLSSFWELFTAVPVVVFAYLCHYNVHPIGNELHDPNKMRPIVQTSLVLCTTVYVTTALFGFLLFGDSILLDMLSNFDTDLGVPYSSLLNDVVRISYAGHITLVFPIIFFPLRLNLDSLIFPNAMSHLADSNLRFGLVSSGLVVAILMGALLIPSIWVAFEFIGATVGALLAFIFPACIALKDPHGIATRKDQILSVLLIVVAVFSSVAAIYSDAYSLLT